MVRSAPELLSTDSAGRAGYLRAISLENDAMTLNEFKAWLEGYSEAFTSGAPTAAQWEKIREKLGEVKIVKAEQSIAPLLPRPNSWPEQRYQLLDVRGKDHLDPISPLLKPQITCTGKSLS